MGIDLLILLCHSAREPENPRGRWQPFPLSDLYIVMCRDCGEPAILDEGQSPETRGYHRDYGRWWYCSEHSEEAKRDA
jgi:hypothetical protein